jgi:hypothetical protein
VFKVATSLYRASATVIAPQPFRCPFNGVSTVSFCLLYICVKRLAMSLRDSGLERGPYSVHLPLRQRLILRGPTEICLGGKNTILIMRTTGSRAAQLG